MRCNTSVAVASEQSPGIAQLSSRKRHTREQLRPLTSTTGKYIGSRTVIHVGRWLTKLHHLFHEMVGKCEFSSLSKGMLFTGIIMLSLFFPWTYYLHQLRSFPDKKMLVSKPCFRSLTRKNCQNLFVLCIGIFGSTCRCSWNARFY